MLCGRPVMGPDAGAQARVLAPGTDDRGGAVPPPVDHVLRADLRRCGRRLPAAAAAGTTLRKPVPVGAAPDRARAPRRRDAGRPPRPGRPDRPAPPEHPDRHRAPDRARAGERPASGRGDRRRAHRARAGRRARHPDQLPAGRVPPRAGMGRRRVLPRRAAGRRRLLRLLPAGGPPVGGRRRGRGGQGRTGRAVHGPVPHAAARGWLQPAHARRDAPARQRTAAARHPLRVVRDDLVRAVGPDPRLSDVQQRRA